MNRPDEVRGSTPVEPQDPASTPGPLRPRWSVLLCWSSYDLANTVFYLLIVTMYVPKYFEAISGDERTVALAFVPAMLLAAILSPAFGVLLQRYRRAKRATLVLTAACCLGSAALWLPVHWLPLCGIYAVSLFAYQMASVSYQSLLPEVAPIAWVGRVSGIGVAMGYFGNIGALVFIKLSGVEEHWGVRGIFVVAAVLFALCTLPLALGVPATGASPGPPPRLSEWLDETRRVFQTLARNLREASLRNFLLGNFLVCDAINSVLVQIVRFAESPGGLGLSAEDRTSLMIVVNIAAVLGAAVLGLLADRWGGRQVTLLSTGLFFAAMAGAQFLGPLWARSAAIAVLGGAGIAGVWTASRLWLVRLVPRERTSEAFGLYGLTMKASMLSLLPFTWLVERTGGSYLPSILLLLGTMGAGLLFWCVTPSGAASARGAEGP